MVFEMSLSNTIINNNLQRHQNKCYISLAFLIDIFCKSGEDKFLNWINEEGQKRLQKLKNSIINN